MTDETLSYAFVESATVIDRRVPQGHKKFVDKGWHGYLDLRLLAQQPICVAVGVTVLGRDVGSDRPLVRPMMQKPDGTLFIPGSSLKGCIRSIYEAITASTVGTEIDKVTFEPCRGKKEREERPRCPASRVFGALGYQGMIEFTDAICNTPATIGDIPIMHSPNPGHDRKFYRTTAQRLDPPEMSHVPIQQAPRGSIFTTRLRFKNLLSEELGTLLIALGQDPNYPMALKLGAGKAHGMGQLTVEVGQAQVYRTEDLQRDRYSSYQILSIEPVAWQIHIQAAHEVLIQQPQLTTLANILQRPMAQER
jgi:CRISPR/Cas system CSM-associated protein Csm3 (group 7 of RAMP superfamily)